jgi:hypothetical protein
MASGLWSRRKKGPYGAAGAQPAPYTANVFLLLQPFDAAVTSDSGDFWADLSLGTATFNPLMRAPGQSGTIDVTITPTNMVSARRSVGSCTSIPSISMCRLAMRSCAFRTAT